MKKTVRAVSACLFLAVLLSFALAACGNTPQTESSESPADSSVTETASGGEEQSEESETEGSHTERAYNQDVSAEDCRALVSNGAGCSVSVNAGNAEKYLTDGMINDIQLNTDGIVFCECAGKDFEITLDLGEVKRGLVQFDLWLMRSSATADIAAMRVYTAGEDLQFSPVSERITFEGRAPTAMGRIYLLCAENSAGADARYVRFSLTPSGAGKAAFAEAAVYARTDNSFIAAVPAEEPQYLRAPESIKAPHVTYSMITSMTLNGVTDEMADRYFDTLQEAGIEGLIILHGSDANGNVYKNSALDHVFSQAQKRGMKVFMGLNASDDIFAKTSAYLAANAAAAKALYERYRVPYPEVFCGWYLSHEFSNGDFAKHPDEVAAILNGVIENVGALDPNLPLMMSPYCTSWGGTAKQLKEDLEKIFSQTNFREFDIYCPQDGVGCGYFSTENVGDYLSAAAVVCKRHNVRFWVNLENFILDSSVPDNVDDIPAPVSRFIRQIRAASAYTDTFVTFTYESYMPEFFSNYTIYNDIREYHEKYLYYLNTGKIPAEEPLAGAEARAEGGYITVWLPTPTYRVQAVRIVRGGEECWYSHRLVRTLGGVSYLTVPDDMSGKPFSVTVYDHSANSTGALRFEKDGTPVQSGGPVDRTKDGVNAALGKTYTATSATHDNKDAGGELTDGKHGAASFSDPAWQGFNGQVYEITVDLGEITHNIGDIALEVLGGGYGAVMEPRSFEAFVSQDGVNFDPVGKLEASDAGTGSLYIKKLTLELKENVSARFVKISVSVIGWLFADEVEIITYE